MSKPRLSSVANHFKEAKTVRCLKNKIMVDVTHNNSYEFNKEANSYTSVGGAITYWKDGEYAEIVNFTKKKCRCSEEKKDHKDCGCNKGKTVKHQKR